MKKLYLIALTATSILPAMAQEEFPDIDMYAPEITMYATEHQDEVYSSYDNQDENSYGADATDDQKEEIHPLQPKDEESSRRYFYRTAQETLPADQDEQPRYQNNIKTLEHEQSHPQQNKSTITSQTSKHHTKKHVPAKSLPHTNTQPRAPKAVAQHARTQNK